jgi:hypothetical protein
MDFFSPQNMTRYLNLFWARFSRHCPIIHKATFDLEKLLSFAFCDYCPCWCMCVTSKYGSSRRETDVGLD